MRSAELMPSRRATFSASVEETSQETHLECGGMAKYIRACKSNMFFTLIVCVYMTGEEWVHFPNSIAATGFN